MIADPNGIDFGTKTYRFGHFSGPSYRGAHAGWPAALLGGQLGFLETYVNQGARAFCLHVNRRPHTQPGAHAGWPAVLLGGQLGFLEAYVNQGPILKRVRPRAQGRAFAIQKKMSHVTIKVAES